MVDLPRPVQATAGGLMDPPDLGQDQSLARTAPAHSGRFRAVE